MFNEVFTKLFNVICINKSLLSVFRGYLKDNFFKDKLSEKCSSDTSSGPSGHKVDIICNNHTVQRFKSI